MNVELYNTSDPPNKVKKTLKNKKVVEGVRFTEEDTLNVVNPKIIISLTSDIQDYATYNYVRIPKFLRYYYIENITTRGGLVEISCRVDPLNSFKSDILGSVQYVTRSENIHNRYIVDNLLPISSKHLYTIQSFGSPAYDENCISVILETTGKGVVS